MKVRILTKTKQRTKYKKFYGFDIETCNNNKEFVLGTIDSSKEKLTFSSKEDMIKEMGRKKYAGAYFVATNLQFDFNGLFEDQSNFNVLYRGSDLISANSYIHEGKFQKSDRRNKVYFIDTMNFCKMSVEAMGKILNLPKLEKPEFLGTRPQTLQELKQLEVYCQRDSEISRKFMEFIEQGLIELGGDMKTTIASSAMKLFRNKYLGNEYFINKTEDLLFQYKSYFGGRTEAFSRGYLENANYYDINSLYPSVMRDNVFPDPNSLRTNKINDVYYLKNFEGCSEVEIYEFENKYPVLPVKMPDGKVLFAYGNKRGIWTNAEIRYAVEQGAVIKHVHKNMYFKKTCTPFKDYVEDLYALRQKYKSEGSKMELTVKLLLNSLYGKFGQKFLDKDNFIHKDMVTLKDLENAKTIEELGDWFRVSKDGNPAPYTIPIWASYVASYGRIKLHMYLKEYGALYCDTDSIVTFNRIPESKNLGEMKKEMFISKGYIVRPKFYAFCSDEGYEYVKIKGLGKRLNYLEFMGLLVDPRHEVYYNKFTKFKESLRQDLIPNEIRVVHKEFSIEDTKRNWPDYFNIDELQTSKPLEMSDLCLFAD